MKKVTLATLMTVATGMATAAPLDFQLQIGSSELDPSIWEGPELAQTVRTPSPFKTSLEHLYELADVDGSQPFRFVGNIVPSGPTRIHLYEAYRGSPEGTAYQSYFERYPSDTDWNAVAQEWKDKQNNV